MNFLKKIIGWLNVKLDIAISRTECFEVVEYEKRKLEDKIDIAFNTVRDDIFSERANRVQMHKDWKEFKGLIDLGVDVHVHPKGQPSWAIFCIAGKTEYIRFIELQPRDLLSLREWLRHFEGTNRIFDRPSGMRDWFMK